MSNIIYVLFFADIITNKHKHGKKSTSTLCTVLALNHAVQLDFFLFRILNTNLYEIRIFFSLLFAPCVTGMNSSSSSTYDVAYTYSDSRVPPISEFLLTLLLLFSTRRKTAKVWLFGSRTFDTPYWCSGAQHCSRFMQKCEAFQLPLYCQKISVQTKRMISIAQASLCSKVLDPQTFSESSDAT